MRFKQALAGTGIALSLAFGAIVPAYAAINLADFDAVDSQRQSQVLAAVLGAYYKHYQSSANTAQVASCMETLYRPVSDGAPPQLLRLIYDEFDLARADASKPHTVEGIVQGVIERECTPKVDQANTVVPAPGPG